jgi:hypothetical protein
MVGSCGLLIQVRQRFFVQNFADNWTDATQVNQIAWTP